MKEAKSRKMEQLARSASRLSESYGGISAVVFSAAMALLGYRLARSVLGLSRSSGSYKGGRDTKGRYHGKGFLRLRNGNEYSGWFKHGQIDGRGKYTFAEGGEYEGEFKNGKYEGKGKEKYADGSEYTGEFSEGLRHGKGVMIYANGSSYEGQWKHGKKNGKGVLRVVDSSGELKVAHVGRFKDGKKVE